MVTMFPVIGKYDGAKCENEEEKMDTVKLVMC